MGAHHGEHLPKAVADVDGDGDGDDAHLALP
jgi:hypothetical protein